jgi:hypothetical protein
MPRDPAVADRRRFVVAVALALVALAFVGIALNTFTVSHGWGFDFDAYRQAAARLARGDPVCPTIGASSPIYQCWVLDGPFRPGPYGYYLYAPPLAVAFLPFTPPWLSVDTAALIWYGLRVALLATGCAVLPVRPTIRLLTFTVACFTEPVLIDLNLGNVSVVVTVLLAFLWRWLDRPVGSVALAIAMSVRPTLGILLGWWLLRRLWRPIAWTIVAGLVMVLVTLPFAGVQSYLDYLKVLRNVSEVTGVKNNLDLGSTVLLLGLAPWVAQLALLAGYALAVVAIAVSLRFDRELSFMVTIGATLLLAPLLWDHYLAILILPAAFLAQRGRVWGYALPLLGWLPQGALPLLAIAATLAPFLAIWPARAEPVTKDRPGGVDQAADAAPPPADQPAAVPAAAAAGSSTTASPR